VTKNTGDQIVEKFQFRQLLGRSRHSSNEIIDRFAVQLRLRRNRYLRDNTVKVSNDVTLFLPMEQETLLREEQEAVKRHAGFDMIHTSTTTRTIVHHEVYHSSSYGGMGHTSSSLVEVAANNCNIYGRIVKFILHQSRCISLIKLMHPHNLNICKESKSDFVIF
jgi:hypothetical protein